MLAAALERGIAPGSTFESRPKLISLGDRFWSVHNYDDVYLGSVTLETATVHSDNAVYADLTQLVGPRAVAATARRLGIKSRLNPYFAIGLGAESVNPLELARAFSAFPMNGYRIDSKIFGNNPRFVSELRAAHFKRTTKDDISLEGRAATVDGADDQPHPPGGRRARNGRRAALPDRPVAGKTGTTENYGDAWFVGYTPQLVAAVWVGDPDELKPMETEFHGDPVAGGTYPALIWKSFMQAALRQRKDPPTSFESPPYLSGTSKRVVWRDGRLLLDNGLCRGARSVVYFSGRGPTRTAAASRTRSRCRTSSGRHSTSPRRGWRRSRSRRWSHTSRRRRCSRSTGSSPSIRGAAACHRTTASRSSCRSR